MYFHIQIGSWSARRASSEIAHWQDLEQQVRIAVGSEVDREAFLLFIVLVRTVQFMQRVVIAYWPGPAGRAGEGMPC